jgi:tetratricopeptide (TPR) repeat protein
VLAGELFLREEYEEAIAYMREAVRESERAATQDLAAARKRDEHLMVLGLMLLATNQLAEAHAVAEDALLVVTGKVGPSHPSTRLAIELLISIELEQRDLARAEKHIEALDRATRAAPTPVDEADVQVDRATLARLRGDLATAEKLARQALDTLVEVKAKPSKIQGARRELGRTLVALHREKEALPLLIESLPLAYKRTAYDCVFELQLAKVERTVGLRTEGDTRAKHCLAKLRAIKGYAALRKETEAWLAE